MRDVHGHTKQQKFPLNGREIRACIRALPCGGHRVLLLEEESIGKCLGHSLKSQRRKWVSVNCFYCHI